MNEQKIIPDYIFYLIWPISLVFINVIGYLLSEHFSVNLLELFGLSNATSDIKALAMLIINFSVFILSLIITGTTVIQLKERNTNKLSSW